MKLNRRFTGKSRGPRPIPVGVTIAVLGGTTRGMREVLALPFSRPERSRGGGRFSHIGTGERRGRKPPGAFKAQDLQISGIDSRRTPEKLYGLRCACP